MTTKEQTARERITEEVTSWPGVKAGPGQRGEFGFSVGRRQIGHLHGSRAAHFAFPKAVWAQLMDEGRIVEHPIRRPGLGARSLETETDIREAIELMRLNYNRAVARHGLPSAA